MLKIEASLGGVQSETCLTVVRGRCKGMEEGTEANITDARLYVMERSGSCQPMRQRGRKNILARRMRQE